MAQYSESLFSEWLWKKDFRHILSDDDWKLFVVDLEKVEFPSWDFSFYSLDHRAISHISAVASSNGKVSKISMRDCSLNGSIVNLKEILSLPSLKSVVWSSNPISGTDLLTLLESTDRKDEPLNELDCSDCNISEEKALELRSWFFGGQQWLHILDCTSPQHGEFRYELTEVPRSLYDSHQEEYYDDDDQDEEDEEEERQTTVEVDDLDGISSQPMSVSSAFAMATSAAMKTDEDATCPVVAVAPSGHRRRAYALRNTYAPQSLGKSTPHACRPPSNLGVVEYCVSDAVFVGEVLQDGRIRASDDRICRTTTEWIQIIDSEVGGYSATTSENTVEMGEDGDVARDEDYDEWE